MASKNTNANAQSTRACSARKNNSGADELLEKYFPVLDYGFVALKDYMGTDECIAEAARVSYQYGTKKKNDTRGLIRYLRRHKHTSPTEQCKLKFHMGMPIFVARQIVRHRTMNINETSARFSILPTLFYSPKSFTTQSTINKQ